MGEFFILDCGEGQLCQRRRSRKEAEGRNYAAGLRLLVANGKRLSSADELQRDDQNRQRCCCGELANRAILKFVSGIDPVEVDGLRRSADEYQQNSEKDQALRKA